MKLKRLIYASVANELCNSAEIENILDDSIELNKIHGITGILYYSNRFFLQYLEGDAPDIESTYARIAQDKRHSALRLIDQSTTSAREFGMWSMGYVPNSEILTPLNKQFMGDTQFNPMCISAAEAVALTLELREALPKAHYVDQHKVGNN